MDESRKKSRDKGVAQVLLMRLEAERLPYALKLVIDRMARLYDEITRKGAENEQKAATGRDR